MKKLLFALLALGLLSVIAPHDAYAQDTRGYYIATVASADFTIDLKVMKPGSSSKNPMYIIVRAGQACTVSFSDEDLWAERASTSYVVGDDIHLFASEAKLLECKTSKLRVVGANGASFDLTAVY